MTDAAPPPAATFGWMGFFTGAAALILTLVVFWAGPFAPQQPAGVSLGELAAEIAKSAARSVAGQAQPAPAAPPWTIDDTLEIVVGGLAGLSIVLGVAAFVRHERRRAALSGIALGGLAVGIQFLAWSIMVVAGALVIMGLMAALRETFGDIFGGLLGD